MEKENISTISQETQNTRQLQGVLRITLKYICIAASLYHLYIGYFGAPFSLVHRPAHVSLILVIIFLLYPLSNKINQKVSNKVPYYDYIFILLTILSTVYLMLNAVKIRVRQPFVTELTSIEFVLGITLIILILVATYRIIGANLCVITTVFLLYGYFGKYLPLPFWHKGYSAKRIVEQLYFTLDGIWGIPIHITATFVYLFVLFATFLVISGTGSFFSDFARSVMGKRDVVGGPPKIAVIASSLMGMLSGSSTANVVTTGAFTIPMMKKSGYSPVFAGAVEAVASTGGQLVPPVMGATAFILAEFTGIPYVQVMKHALIPAFLFYLGLYVMVHIEALKYGDEVNKKVGKIESMKSILLSKGYLVFPVIAIIVLLVRGYTPLRAAFSATIILIFIVFLFNKDKKKVLKMIPAALEEAPKVICSITVACACAGIIVGIITMTGLGQRITSIILLISRGSLPITLILTMLLAILLGMGMPTSGAYIIMAALLAPAMIKMGVPLIAAHMFLFYFAALSSITPPVAIASYAAAGITGASSVTVGWKAFRIGIAAYIVPYMFLYNPSLLMVGNLSTAILPLISAIIGVICIAITVQGRLYTVISILERLLFFAAAFILIIPNIIGNIIGILIFIPLVIKQRAKVKNQ